jgi:hypothetical protein
MRRIVSYYKGADAVAMEKLLRESGVTEVKSSNLRLQPLFDSLSLARRSRVELADAARRSSRDSLAAMLILVDRLEQPGVTAIVERRAEGSPRDLIIMASASVTAENLRPALGAVVKLRRARTSSVGAVGERIVLRGPGAQARWNADQRAQASRDIARLKAQPLREINGVGIGRSIEILIVK